MNKVTLTPEQIAKSRNGSGEQSAALEIARLVLDPEEDKLPGFTRIPLDQVRPCSFASAFVDELIKICELARKDQQAYSANWKLWHSEVKEIPGLGRRTPPKNKETFFPKDYRMSVIDVNKDARFKIPKVDASIVQKWLKQYYRLRRSTTPDFSMGAFELASREVETRQPNEDDIFKDARVQ